MPRMSLQQAYGSKCTEDVAEAQGNGGALRVRSM